MNEMKGIPHQPLHDIIGAIKDIENKNMMEIVTIIYEATYLRYHMKFFEEKGMRERLEQRMIKKNQEIEELQLRIKELEDANGTSISEDSEAETQGN